MGTVLHPWHPHRLSTGHTEVMHSPMHCPHTNHRGCRLLTKHSVATSPHHWYSLQGTAFDQSHSFDPAQWRVGPGAWRSPFALPLVLASGQLASFGEDARRLLTDHFTDRSATVDTISRSTQLHPLPSPSPRNL